MFDTLFGAEMPLAVRFFLAFLIVLGLIGATAWAVRRFGTGRLGGAGGRGRQPRLAVIDYASVDGRRRLILVRRDNVEHLMMIGGPTDVVVEANIVRAVAAPRDLPGARPTAGIEALPRAVPLPESGNGSSWPLAPEPAGARPAARIEPLPDELPRPFQGLDEPRPQRTTLTALAEELSSRPTPPRGRSFGARALPDEPHQEARGETRAESRKPMPPPAAPLAAETTADQSLADMAARLESALRKPPAASSARAATPEPDVPDEAARRRRRRRRRRRSARPARARPSARTPSPARINRRFTTASNRRWRVCWAVRPRPDARPMGPPRSVHNRSGLCSGTSVLGDAARRAGYQHQSRARRRRRRRAQRAHHPVDRADDGAVAGAVDPGHDDVVYPHRGGAVAVAHRARHRDRAAQFGRHLAGACF